MARRPAGRLLIPPSWTLLALLSCLLLGAAFGTPRAEAMRPLTTGMSGVYDYSLASYGQVHATGATFVRIGLPWGAVAPNQAPSEWQPEDPADPHYRWDSVDEAVRNATATGLTPVLLVNSAPLWAQRCRAPSSLPEAVCDPEPRLLAQFAVAAARRYSGDFAGLPRVRYYQGPNEPNLSLYFLPQYRGSTPVSPRLYRPLINAFYAAIKSVSRSNLVLAGGLGPIAVPHWTIGPLRFARLLLCMRGRANPHPLPGNCHGGVHFDIFDVHPYTTGGPAHEGGRNDVQLGDIPELQALLRAADRAGRIRGEFKRTPLWVMEFSWDSKPPDPKGLPMGIECRWVSEALFRTWRAGVSHFFWYGLRDEPLIPGLPPSASLQSGLYFSGSTLSEDTPKRVLSAFRFPFVAYPRPHGLYVWGRTPTGAPGTVAVQVLFGGHWRDVSHLPAGRGGMFAASIPNAYGAERRGAVRAVYRGSRSLPFSMHPIKEFRQPPFG